MHFKKGKKGSRAFWFLDFRICAFNFYGHCPDKAFIKSIDLSLSNGPTIPFPLCFNKLMLKTEASFQILDSSATINLQASTSNELRLVTGQEKTVICNIAWVCKSTQRDVEEEFLEVLFCWWDANKCFEPAHLLASKSKHEVWKPSYLQSSTTQKRANRVDSDLLLAVFCCEAFRCLKFKVSVGF